MDQLIYLSVCQTTFLSTYLVDLMFLIYLLYPIHLI